MNEKESIPLHTTGIPINEFTAQHHTVVMVWVWNGLCAGFLTDIIFEKFACTHAFWIDANLKLKFCELLFMHFNCFIVKNYKRMK